MSEIIFRRELVGLLSKMFRVHPIENKLTPGMPDLLVIRYFNEPIWMELKKEQGKLRKSQVAWIRSHPEEKVLVATLFQGQVFFFRRKGEDAPGEVWWDEIHHDQWPGANPEEIWTLIHNE